MKYSFPIALAIAGIFFSCQNKSENNSPSVKPSEILSPSTPNPEFVSDSAVSPAFESQAGQMVKSKTPFQLPQKKSPSPVPEDWDKKIIRNADLNLEVADFKSSDKSISEAIRLSGGYIASSTEQTLDEEIKTEMTIRVPREKFDELVNQICSYGKNVLQKNISSQDVTEEYVDTKSRILTREKMLARYHEFLQQARKIDEVLEVQDQINNIQEEIDVATGRANYINHQSVFNTIHLVVFQKFSPGTPNPGFLTRLVYNLKDGWVFCEDLFLGMAKFWPLYMTAFGIWAVVRRKKKLNPVPMAKSEPNV